MTELTSRVARLEAARALQVRRARRRRALRTGTFIIAMAGMAIVSITIAVIIVATALRTAF